MRVLDLALTKLSERVITGGSLPVKATEGDTDLTCEQACANTGLTLAEEMAGGVSRAVLDKRISCQIEMASELSGRLQAEATEGLADLTCAQAYATAGLTLAKEMAGCVSPVLDKRIPCVTTPSTPRG